jgi:hypothetical protein
MFQDSIRTCNYLSELDDVVLNVHGRDSPTVKPVAVRDSDVYLQES